MSHNNATSQPNGAQTPEPKAFLSRLRSQSLQALQERVFNTSNPTTSSESGRRTLVLVRYYGGKVWILNRRVHHGFIGTLATVVGITTTNPAFITGGIFLTFHDREDWPWPIEKLK